MQSHGDGWRARKKHAGQWFMGPVRESVQLAEEDARQFEDASAVSLEAMQEVQRNLTSSECEARNVVVEKRSTGWRLRCGTKEQGGQRRYGPIRKEKAVAEEDVRRVSVAFGVSLQEVERIFAELFRSDSTDPNLAVEKRSAGWRLRCGTKEQRRYGLTRSEKGQAEEDLRRVRAAFGVSRQEVEKVFEELTTEGGSAPDNFPLQYLQVCLGKLNPAALPRRLREKHRSQENNPENAAVVHACKLLVSEHQLAENLASRVDARWLHDMGLHWRLDSGSRPVGTSGFDHVSPITGLRNLGNSCWLNALLQCFLACGPLAKDLLDQTCEKGPLRHWLTATLVKLRSRDFDSVAPFE